MHYEYRRHGRFGDFMGNLAVAVFFGAFIFALFAWMKQSADAAREASLHNGGFGGAMSNVDVRTVVMPLQMLGGFAPQRGRESSSCGGYGGYDLSTVALHGSSPYFNERPSNTPCPYCGRTPYGVNGW